MSLAACAPVRRGRGRGELEDSSLSLDSLLLAAPVSASDDLSMGTTVTTTATTTTTNTGTTTLVTAAVPAHTPLLTKAAGTLGYYGPSFTLKRYFDGIKLKGPIY